MTKKVKLTKELFDMVYSWGRWGLVVDYKAPAFRSVVRQLVAESKKA